MKARVQEFADTDASDASKFSSEVSAMGRVAAVETRARISQAVNIKSPPWPEDQHETRLRRDGEIPSMKAAVKWKCYECMGYEPEGFGSMLNRVKNCECTGCPLWPWRGGEFDKELFR